MSNSEGFRFNEMPSAPKVDETTVLSFLESFNVWFENISLTEEQRGIVEQTRIDFGLKQKDWLFAHVNQIIGRDMAKMTDEERLSFFGAVLDLDGKLDMRNPLSDGGSFTF